MSDGSECVDSSLSSKEQSSREATTSGRGGRATCGRQSHMLSHEHSEYISFGVGNGQLAIHGARFPQRVRSRAMRFSLLG